MNTMLFGIALAPLYAAIAQVESENGRTSNNVYQITFNYIEDVNRIAKLINDEPRYLISDKFDRGTSERMMSTYWLYYGTQYYRKTGRMPTAEILVRIHNGGPNGWKRPTTLKYWHKVKAAMEGKLPFSATANASAQ